ncbi:Alpha/Beta hydrolase protein [Xylariaceae sp. FL1272]|nr:Alpha/Beta hydrolase protein [Xylariaceae sp. FL1272]
MSSEKSQIPTTGTRTQLAASVKAFLSENPTLHLGGRGDFHAERRHHLQVFGFHNLPREKQAPIGHVHFDGVRGRNGTIPVRLFYPRARKEPEKLPALIYFHGGGYTVDEFENGLRLIAEEANVIVGCNTLFTPTCNILPGSFTLVLHRLKFVDFSRNATAIGVEYRLAPEWSFPVQLYEYEDVLGWAQGSEGSKLGIDANRVLGGGDSAGGNMTAAISLRLKDENSEGRKGPRPLKAQILLYPEARLPFDTPAATENNSGYYLECNGIFSFADHYLPRAPDRSYPPAHRYVSPGLQQVENLKGLPPAAVFTCGFDPLRDVGVEYASKLKQAGNHVEWHHYPELTHGFLQMAPWSEEAMRATKQVAKVVRELAA